MTFHFDPYKGAHPIKFGMSPNEVHQALDESPTRSYERASGLREDFSGLGINYDENKEVAEICFFPGASVIFEGHDLLSSDPNIILKKYEKTPIELHGFLVYPKIGVNTCGYHDQDDSQRAFNVFRQGYWNDIIDACHSSAASNLDHP